MTNQKPRKPEASPKKNDSQQQGQPGNNKKNPSKSAQSVGSKRAK